MIVLDWIESEIKGYKDVLEREKKDLEELERDAAVKKGKIIEIEKCISELEISREKLNEAE